MVEVCISSVFVRVKFARQLIADALVPSHVYAYYILPSILEGESSLENKSSKSGVELQVPRPTWQTDFEGRGRITRFSCLASL